MNECATELRTLLHPARKLPRHSRTEAGEPDRFEQHFRPLALLSPLSALLASERFDNLERQEHIVAYRTPGQQCRILKGHADALQWPRDLFPAYFHASPRRPNQASNELEQRGFAAAAWPYDSSEFALADREIRPR